MSAFNNETGNEQGSSSGYKEEVKEIRIEGSNYDVNEEEILDWIQMYGDIQGEVEEEAIEKEKETFH